jgi:ribosomal protein S18 acetylase RimI-like enzyme
MLPDGGCREQGAGCRVTDGDETSLHPSPCSLQPVSIRKAVTDDAPRIHEVAESLRYRPPGSEKGFLVHVRTEEEYRRILDISCQSHAAEEDGILVGFLLVHSMPELEELTKDVLAADRVVTHVLGLGDQTAMYADQIGVDLAARSRGIGQQLASAMMAENPKTRFLAAIMHRPSKNMPSLRLALRNGWHLTTEVWDSEYLWGIYEIHSP